MLYYICLIIFSLKILKCTTQYLLNFIKLDVSYTFVDEILLQYYYVCMCCSLNMYSEKYAVVTVRTISTISTISMLPLDSRSVVTPSGVLCQCVYCKWYFLTCVYSLYCSFVSCSETVLVRTTCTYCTVKPAHYTWKYQCEDLALLNTNASHSLRPATAAVVVQFFFFMWCHCNWNKERDWSIRLNTALCWTDTFTHSASASGF